MATTAEGLRIGGLRGATAGDTALRTAVQFWFGTALVGQLLFVVHIVSFYSRMTLAGNFAEMNKHLERGYVPGDHIGNAALGVHLTVAALITTAGLLQLIPQIRAHFPSFHRWTGRAYLAAAVLASASALYLSAFRGKLPGGFFQHLGTNINALVILLCAAMALRYALARDFQTHRRWAMRLFLAVSGVWFFRVGLFFWLLVNHGQAVGFDEDKFEGPALTFLSYIQYLLPLAVLEIYLRTQTRAGAAGKIALAAGLVVLTIAMGVGIFGVSMFWVSTGTAV